MYFKINLSISLMDRKFNFGEGGMFFPLQPEFFFHTNKKSDFLHENQHFITLR